MIFQSRVGHFKPGFLISPWSKLDNLSANNKKTLGASLSVGGGAVLIYFYVIHVQFMFITTLGLTQRFGPGQSLGKPKYVNYIYVHIYAALKSTRNPLKPLTSDLRTPCGQPFLDLS